MQNEVVKGILDFILGGDSNFTIYQEKPEFQARYRIVRSKDTKVYFIYTGENKKSMKYQGYVTRDDLCNLKQGKNGLDKAHQDKRNLKALWWVMWHAENLPNVVHVLHNGRCSVCGKPLTDAISLSYGVGPTCRKRLENKQK